MSFYRACRTPLNCFWPKKVTQISDSWEGNIIGLTLKHLVPGFWDIWHQLGSPPAEKIPYKVLKKAWEYEIREYAPRLVYQPSLIDRSNSREVRLEATAIKGGEGGVPSANGMIQA